MKIKMLSGAGVSWGTVNSRTAWIFAGVLAVFEVDLLRAAALLDMFGYLSSVPLAIYLRERFRGENAIGLYTFAGLASTIAFLAAAGFSSGTLMDPARLVTVGARGAVALGVFGLGFASLTSGVSTLGKA